MNRRVLLVAPSPPPYGGMALQSRLLERLLKDDGTIVRFVAVSDRLPRPLRRLERIPVLRTCVRTAVIWARLCRWAPAVDVVHIFGASWYYFWSVVAPAVFIGRILGKRVVLNYRAGNAAEFFRAHRAGVRAVFRQADAITAPSAFLASVIREQIGTPVSMVSNIVDTSKFRYRKRTGIQPRLVVSRHLEKIYDVESVLRAFRIVRERYPDASLQIAGDGSQEACLRKLVAEWHLGGVQFLGHVPHREMPALYDSCDILVNASRVDNFPAGLVEASAAGLVVVSTAGGGIPAIYTDRQTAFLVSPGDWRQLAEAILQALDSPSQALTMAERALALVRGCEWVSVRRDLYTSYGFLDEAMSAQTARSEAVHLG
jgi:glycosyltransferase involved in cell wall biosynthesis